MIVGPRQLGWVKPDWSAPLNVQAHISTRSGSVSQTPYDGFNTADHVGAPANDVANCRRLFQQHHQIQTQPQWLDQVHGVDVVEAKPDGVLRSADASYTRKTHVVCTLHTADCLPVLFCDQHGTQVAAAHAGWRGLDAGILENTVSAFDQDNNDILCWIGPAISRSYFEVGAEVKARFEDSQQVPNGAFVASGRVSEAGEHFLCDLFLLAKARLNAIGVTKIYGADLCSYSDPRFFSYRRQAVTGRTLSAIWLSPRP